MLTCPIDQHRMVKKVYEGTTIIDICTKCNGVWLDKGELEKIEEVRMNDYSEELKRIPDYLEQNAELLRQQDREAINCPVCGESMVAKEYGYCSQIMIDVCPNCQGIWLDSGELQELEIFFERSKLEKKGLRKGFFRSLLRLGK